MIVDAKPKREANEDIENRRSDDEKRLTIVFVSEFKGMTNGMMNIVDLTIEVGSVSFRLIGYSLSSKSLNEKRTKTMCIFSVTIDIDSPSF
jgi:rRNA maturation protein Rpf1